MVISPIHQKKISQVIIEEIISLVSEGKLKVGDKLPPEREMSRMFGVSRVPLREAICAMEIIGLIDVRQGEGSFITDVNIVPFIRTISQLLLRNESMESELIELRKLLEIEAIKLIISQEVSPEKLDRLEKVVKEMSDSIGKGIELGILADVSFHKMLFELSGNYILAKAGECISLIIESSVKFNREKILRNKENFIKLYEQHKTICNAILNKDESLAVETMVLHLDFVKEASY
jgi:GntR family transcriptional regulator, transcriptional repressor for pyruvate dehydrogenase complex